MSRAPAEWRLMRRAGTMNACTCCGMPFASIGRDGDWVRHQAEFEDAYAQACPRAGGCFDAMQEAHLMHALQREEGASCMDNNLFVQDRPDGPGGKGMPRRKPGGGAAAAAAGGGAAAADGGEEGGWEGGADEEEEVDGEAEEAARQEREDEERRRQERRVTRSQTRVGGVGGVGMFLQVDAVDNAQGTWGRIRHINIDKVLQRLGECLVQDSDSGLVVEYRDFEKDDDNNDYWPEIYDVTFPACARCNTLMTMMQRSTHLLVALRALEKDWFKAGRASRSLAVRKYRYGLLIRKSVQEAEKQLGNVDPRLTQHNGPDEHLPPVQTCAIVQLMQTVFLAIAAATACAGIDEKEADHFRYAGIRRLYLSAVMWVLCRIRWSSAFRTPFHHWHIHYVENMPLAQKRRWHHWLFGGREPIQLGPDAKVTLVGIRYMLRRALQPALLALMKDDDGAATRQFEQSPSLWQLMYLCVDNLQDRVFDAGTGCVRLADETARFLPDRGYPQWVEDKGRRDAARLDVGAWVTALGPRIALRRMVTCAVFHLPQPCADQLLVWLLEGTAGPVDEDLLQKYQRFMCLHYEEVDTLCTRHLRGGRQAPAALDATAHCGDFDAAAAFDRVTAVP